MRFFKKMNLKKEKKLKLEAFNVRVIMGKSQLFLVFFCVFFLFSIVLLLTLTLIVHAYYDSGTCVGGFNRENRS